MTSRRTLSRPRIIMSSDPTTFSSDVSSATVVAATTNRLVDLTMEMQDPMRNCADALISRSSYIIG